MPQRLLYKDEKGELLKDKIGRVFRRLVGSVSDKCVVCGKDLFNKNNPKQLVLYCSKECRRTV